MVKSIFFGVSKFAEIKISTYQLFVLYATSRHFSIINAFSWRESTLALKKSGFLETKNSPNAMSAAPMMIIMFSLIVQKNFFLFISFQIDKIPTYL
jgi:6-phosphogluconolactonase (cycloisomerase 2 family)